MMSGHNARASCTGIALPTPNSLASREHAMTQVRSASAKGHDANRSAAPLRTNGLLNRGKESVEVEVQALDLFRPAHHTFPPTSSGAEVSRHGTDRLSHPHRR